MPSPNTNLSFPKMFCRKISPEATHETVLIEKIKKETKRSKENPLNLIFLLTVKFFSSPHHNPNHRSKTHRNPLKIQKLKQNNIGCHMELLALLLLFSLSVWCVCGFFSFVA